MQTIRLKVNGKANDKLLSSDRKDKKKDDNLFTKNSDFEKTKKHLQDSLTEIESGNAIFYTIEEAEFLLEKIISSKNIIAKQ